MNELRQALLPPRLGRDDWNALVQDIRDLEQQPTPEAVAEFNEVYGTDYGADRFEFLWASQNATELAAEVLAVDARHVQDLTWDELVEVVRRSLDEACVADWPWYHALLEANARRPVSDLLFYPCHELSTEELAFLAQQPSHRKGLDHRTFGEWLFAPRPRWVHDLRPALELVQMRHLASRPELLRASPEVVLRALSSAFELPVEEWGLLIEQWRSSYSPEGIRSAMQEPADTAI